MKETLSHTYFVPLLDRADIRQSEFARLAGVTARQVSKWCHGRAAILALALQNRTPDSLEIGLAEIRNRYPTWVDDSQTP